MGRRFVCSGSRKHGGRFVHRTQLDERNVLRNPARSLKNPCLQHRMSLICNAISASSAQRHREHLCVDVGMPFLHRPLVQFLLDIPASQLLRVGEYRSLQRRAMKGILPELIRNRGGKRSPDEPFLRAVAKNWVYLMEQCRDPITARLGIINRTNLTTALERARLGHAKYLGCLFRTLTLELWLRQPATRKRFGL
jgi:hypothetical protein